MNINQGQPSYQRSKQRPGPSTNTEPPAHAACLCSSRTVGPSALYTKGSHCTQLVNHSIQSGGGMTQALRDNITGWALHALWRVLSGRLVGSESSHLLSHLEMPAAAEDAPRNWGVGRGCSRLRAHLADRETEAYSREAAHSKSPSQPRTKALSASLRRR